MTCTCGVRRSPRCAASNGVTVHPALGRISRRDLRAVDRAARSLSAAPPPARSVGAARIRLSIDERGLLPVAPATRAARRSRRDHGARAVPRVRRGWRSGGRRPPSVHRVMTIILARAASRIWIAIPDWERRWRPYALGRDVPFAWLPIPSSLPEPAPDDVRRVRDRYALRGRSDRRPSGSYGTRATRALSASLPDILRAVAERSRRAARPARGRSSSAARSRSSAARPADSRDGSALLRRRWRNTSARATCSSSRIRTASAAAGRARWPASRSACPWSRRPAVSRSLSGRRRGASRS